MSRHRHRTTRDAPAADPPAFARPKARPPERPCAHVSPREASYLLALHELQREDTPVTQVALAREMQVSTPAAFDMIKRLRTLGLVEPEQLILSNEGTSAALLLASRRHAALVLTQELLGLDDQVAEPEAARLAPNLSAAIARRLIAGHNDRT